MLARTALVPVPDRVRSSYDAQGRAGGPRAACLSLASRSGGKMTPDAAEALGKLSDAVEAAGGDLRVTDCYRSSTQQAAYRTRYETWLAAGRPPVGSSKYNPSTMKADFVAKPGRSMHGAGRAVDLHTSFLIFPGIAANGVLDRLWELAIPLGWTPIIKAPTEGVSESWHMDYFGPFRLLRDLEGYEAAAIGATLDIGDGSGFDEHSALCRRLQSGLHRAGYDCGDIDGIVAKRTQAALRAAGFAAAANAPMAEMVLFVDRLPDATRTLWRG